MPPRRVPNPGPAVYDLQDALQILPASEAVGGLDRRSLGKSQRLIGELEAQGKPSEIAKLLGVKTQKYVAIRKQVMSGNIASPTLNDLLESTLEQSRALSFGEKTGSFVNEKHQWDTIPYIAVPVNFIDDKVQWANRIGEPGGYVDLQDALNWYGGVGGANEYFWIAFKLSKRTGRTRYYIYDIRTVSELNQHRKGKSLTKELKAVKTLRKYGAAYGIKNIPEGEDE